MCFLPWLCHIISTLSLTAFKMFLTFQNILLLADRLHFHMWPTIPQQIKYHNEILSKYSSDGGDIWRWWRKPKFVVFLTIKYIESINYCIKTNTTNSDYVIVYKAFIQESHLSILILLDGGDIWWCWQIWHFFHKTNGVHITLVAIFFLLMRDANGTCFRRIKWSKYSNNCLRNWSMVLTYHGGDQKILTFRI